MLKRRDIERSKKRSCSQGFKKSDKKCRIKSARRSKKGKGPKK